MSTISPLAIAGLQVVGTLVGAAIGGTLTWLTAAKKLRGERAYDRRLEWHERMHGCLVAAFNLIDDATIQLKYSAKYSDEVAWDTMVQAIHTIRDERVPAQLYAGPEVIRKLADLRLSVADTLLGKDSEPKPRPSREEAVRSFEAVTELLLDAMFAVAVEARSHLGVERMTAAQLREATRAEVPVTRRESVSKALAT